MNTNPAPLSGEVRLQRALDIHRRFLRGEERGSPADLLRTYADLADLLRPLLLPEPTEPSDTAPAAGDGHWRQLGAYRLLREVGRGSMGVVYAAEHPALGRQVAVKVLPEYRVPDARALVRFRREAQLAAGLDHPGITRVFDVEEVDGTHFFVMELVAGVALHAVVEAMRARGRPATGPALGALVQDLVDAANQNATRHTAPAANWSGTFEHCALQLTVQVADALAHAHGAGVVHRDVKPGNILVRADGSAVLTDFGLARLEGVVGCTLTGDFAGTPSYASPEQVRGRTDIDHRSDVFSLGVTAYELLTLHKPFAGDTISETCDLILRHEPRAPRHYNPHVSADVEAVLARALEKDVAQRYASATAFAEDLRRCLDGRPVSARPVPRSTRLLRWARRNPLAASFLCTASAAAIALAALSVTVYAKEQLASERLDQFRTVRTVRDVQVIRRSLETAPAPPPEQATELRARAESVRTLLARLPELRAQHTALASSGRPTAQPAPQRLLTQHPAQATLDNRRAGLVSLRAKVDEDRAAGAMDPAWQPVAATRIEALAAEVDALQAWVDQRRRREFADSETEFLHDTLEDLIAELEWIEAHALPALTARLHFAEHGAAELARAHASAWHTTIAAAARNPRYAGLQLRPQPGLVPLGADHGTGLLEFAHAPSGSIPVRDTNGALALDAASAIVLVLVPGGRARIGTADDPDDPRYDELSSVDEVPLLEVDLAPFFLAKHELSHGQWNRLAAGLPAHHQAFDLEARPGFAEKPIVRVDWLACTVVCEAFAMTLPTEAQWEWACRGGRDTPWWTGADPASLHQHEHILPPDGEPRGRVPVYGGSPNPFGLYHMHGNVLEWCRDALVKSGGELRPGDGLRLGAADGELRAIRGGAYDTNPRMSRCSKRNSFGARAQMQVVGMRPCMPVR